MKLIYDTKGKIIYNVTFKTKTIGASDLPVSRRRLLAVFSLKS